MRTVPSKLYISPPRSSSTPSVGSHRPSSLLVGSLHGLGRFLLLLLRLTEGYASVLLAVGLEAAEHARALHAIRPTSAKDEGVERGLDGSEDERRRRGARRHCAARLHGHEAGGVVLPVDAVPQRQRGARHKCQGGGRHDQGEDREAHQ